MAYGVAAMRLGAACLLLNLGFASSNAAICPGAVNMPGYGQVQLIPHGWADGSEALMSVSGSDMTVQMGGRGYFADTCTAGQYTPDMYMGAPLLGRRMRYSVDLSGLGCGCNAAMYLVSMKQNNDPCTGGDYYCDANLVCGVACAEIDIQEANMHAWHSTLHAGSDKAGVARGIGGGGWSWNGPRDWSTTDYGQGGRCVDT